MKVLLGLCLCLVAAAQAWPKVKWADERPQGFVNPVVDPNAPKRRGAEVLRGELPYQAAIVLDGARICSGSLVSQTAVLTSAHCITTAGSWEVHLGGAPGQRGYLVLTSQVAVVHDEVLLKGGIPSLGLIKFNAPVQLSDTIQPIRLPSRSPQGRDLQHQGAMVSGWGTTADGHVQEGAELRVSDVTLLSRAECATELGLELPGAWRPAKLGLQQQQMPFSWLCVASSAASQEPCSGDSGSGVVVLESDGERTLLGVISRGHGSRLPGCEDGKPELALRLNSYVDWIAANGGPAARP